MKTNKWLKGAALSVVLAGAGYGVLSMSGTSDAQAADMVVYKDPSCGCCGAWIEHIKANGISVDVRESDDMSTIKAQLGVPEGLQSCHTAQIDGYIVEGHVPADDVKRLISERPDAAGLSVPGMPIGSPGMEMGDEKDPYAVVLYGPKGDFVYSRHN